MNTRRDYQGRLNMDAVREHCSGSMLLRQEDLSCNRVDLLNYTAKWINPHRITKEGAFQMPGKRYGIGSPRGS